MIYSNDILYGLSSLALNLAYAWEAARQAFSYFFTAF